MTLNSRKAMYTINKATLVTAAFFTFMILTSVVDAAIVLKAEWNGSRYGNAAAATGLLTIDETSLPNPGNTGYIPIASSWVTALTLTVTGANTGNGVFTINDFDLVTWDTMSATLDFSKELVGQPTVANAWGTNGNNAGDFNFGVISVSSSAPAGTAAFQLTTSSGTGSRMMLTSLRVIPEPSSAML